MKSSLLTGLMFMVMCLGLVTVASADRDDSYDHSDNGELDTVQVKYLWLLNGIRNTYDCEIPPTDQGTTIASCHDHEIIDLKTGEILGMATDATADLSQEGSAFVATGTTTFRLPQGTLIIRNRGVIQPMAPGGGSPTLDRSPVTHIAGIFPNDPEENNVIGGTGLFKKAKGNFALLGALDLTNAAGGQSKFHCVYFIDLKLDAQVVKRFKKDKKRFSDIDHLLDTY